MSNFIEELDGRIRECQVASAYKSLNLDEVDYAIGVLNSLGENARWMLEVGIVQDELVKLGFEKTDFDAFYHKRINFTLWFYKDSVFIYDIEFKYDSPTFQQDLLAKVRELINA